MIYIKALSYYLPEQLLTNEDLVKEFPDWSVDKIAQKVGVNTRHIAGENETAGDMGEKAARKLFEEYHIDPQTIDFLLLCTQSPDYFLPSTACIIEAKGLLAAGIAKNVLLITSETYTKYLHLSDKSNRSIFGDGATACLISTEGFAEIGDFVLGTDGGGANNLIIKTGMARHKAMTGKYTTDEEGHVNFDDYLYMNGGNVFNFTLDIVPSMMNDVLVKNNLTQEQIDYYVFHQANKFMLNTIRKVCRLPKDKFYINLEDTGNTVSSTIFIGLKDCLENSLIQKGNSVMVAGFGVGLSWGGTILKF